MSKLKNNHKLTIVLMFGGILAGAALYGCQSGQNASSDKGATPTTQPVTFALFGPAPKKSGADLWADNCTRCHNGRPPQEFSAGQWEVIVHHMRLRANLTGEEAREVTKFLQATH